MTLFLQNVNSASYLQDIMRSSGGQKAFLKYEAERRIIGKLLRVCYRGGHSQQVSTIFLDDFGLFFQVSSGIRLWTSDDTENLK